MTGVPEWGLRWVSDGSKTPPGLIWGGTYPKIGGSQMGSLAASSPGSKMGYLNGSRPGVSRGDLESATEGVQTYNLFDMHIQ